MISPYLLDNIWNCVLRSSGVVPPQFVSVTGTPKAIKTCSPTLFGEERTYNTRLSSLGEEPLGSVKKKKRASLRVTEQCLGIVCEK